MSDSEVRGKATLAKSLFRREAAVLLITFAGSLIIFILSLGFMFQTLWDQATQALRMEIEKEADTIARLLVFEFSHLTELEKPKSPDSTIDEQVKRRLWEKVTFNETIRGIELIQGQADPQGRHLTYSYFPLSLEKSGAELGPQKTWKTFSGPEGSLIEIINREQRVDKSMLDSINQGQKIESELLLRYFPLYIPLPDQGAIYWGVTKVGINVDAMRRFLILLEEEKADLRRTLIITVGIISLAALGLGFLGTWWISRRIAEPLENYAIINDALTGSSGVDIKSLLAHLQHQETQGIVEFEQLKNFSLKLGGTIHSLGERLIEAEWQACLGRVAGQLAESGRIPGAPGWAGLFRTLPDRWQGVSLDPYMEQIGSLLTALVPPESLSADRQKLPLIYGNEAHLVQAALYMVDYVLTERPATGQLQWRVLPLETGGARLEFEFSGRQYSEEEIARWLRPFKNPEQVPLLLGPFMAAALGKQQGGGLVIQPKRGGGLALRLDLPDNRGTGASGGNGEKAGS